MGWKISLAFMVGTAGAGSLYFGCTEPPPKAVPDASSGTQDAATEDNSDSSSEDSLHSDSGNDTGAPSDTCKPDKPYIPVPWAPPTNFDQKKCTDAQQLAYYAAYKAGNPAPFRADPANAECLSCIETPADAAAHGPIIVLSNGSVEANYGGCVAHYDGNTSATGCGAILNGYNNCAIQECGDCKDYTEPPYTMAKACLSAAVDGGACKNLDTTAACQAEISDGGEAQYCSFLDNFLHPWCAEKPEAGTDSGH